MLKPVLNTATRGLAIACMTAVGIPTAWSEGPSPPQFRNGRACWDTLCDRLPGKMRPPVADERSTPAPKTSNQAAASQPPATSPWTMKTVPLPPTQALGKTSARADAFYKYPMISCGSAAIHATWDKPAVRASNARRVVLAGSRQHQDTGSGRL
jgi:hypothetical protein